MKRKSERHAADKTSVRDPILRVRDLSDAGDISRGKPYVTRA